MDQSKDFFPSLCHNSNFQLSLAFAAFFSLIGVFKCHADKAAAAEVSQTIVQPLSSPQQESVAPYKDFKR